MPQTSYIDERHESIRWNNSELVTPADLNYAQNLRDRRMIDDILHDLFVTEQFDPGGQPQPTLRPMMRALAQRGEVGGPLRVTLQPGCIFWRQANVVGVDPRWIAHHLELGLTVSLDAADPTNPRIDVISAKVEYAAPNHSGPDSETRVVKLSDGSIVSQTFDKRRRTRLTVTYTPGTPNSVPQPPNPPADEVKIAEVDVFANMPEVPDTSIRDFRTPAGHTRIDVMLGAGASDAATLDDTFDWTASAAAQSVLLPIQPPAYGFPMGASGHVQHLRLRTLTLTALVSTGGNFVLGHRSHLYGAALEQLEPLVGQITLDVGKEHKISESVFSSPVWAGGLRNPLIADTGHDIPHGHSLSASTVFGASGDRVQALVADFWGM